MPRGEHLGEGNEFANRSKSKLRGAKQHTISLGEADENFLAYIMQELGCGKAEAVRTAVRVYAAILMDKRRPRPRYR